MAPPAPPPLDPPVAWRKVMTAYRWVDDCKVYTVVFYLLLRGRTYLLPKVLAAGERAEVDKLAAGGVHEVPAPAVVEVAGGAGMMTGSTSSSGARSGS